MKSKFVMALIALANSCIAVLAHAAIELDEISDEKKPRALTQLPAIPVDLGGAGKLSLSTSSAAYAFQDDNIILKLNAGINHIDRTLAITGADFALMTGDNAALGMNLLLSADKSEIVLSGVNNFTELGLRARGAVSYMKGTQQFDFFRSSARANLSQLGYYGSMSWVSGGESDLGVQSVGVAMWGAKAQNHSTFDTQTYVDDTPDYWLVTRDRRLISAGRLKGASLNFQAAPHVDFVINGALGAEYLQFPFSDGSFDSQSSLFGDAKVSYRINDNNTLSVGYKYGVSEKGVRAEWKSSAYTVSAHNNLGNSGLAGDYGVTVSVELIELLSKPKSKPSTITLAASMRLKMLDNSKQLLQEAISRPSQLPSNFLAKVDPTAVAQLKIEKNGTAGVTVDPDGNLLITINATQAGLIESVTRNGSAVDENGLFAMQGAQLIVYTSQLPVPSAVDAYVVTIKDGSNSVVVQFDFSKG